MVAAAALVTFTACNDGSDGATGADGLDAGTSKWSFSELAVPVTDEEKSSILATSSITNAKDGMIDSVSFTSIITAGTVDNGETFGAVKDFEDNVVLGADGAPVMCDGANGDIGGSGLDHTSILVKNDRIFAVSQFECANGSMYGFELNQADDGSLSMKENSLQYISQKKGFGGWVHCAGMTTPWQSHLGSEEYEPNARIFTAADYNETLGYFDAGYGEGDYFNENLKYYWGGDNTKTSPYFYGYIPEVTVDGSAESAAYSYAKHYSMGRAAWEMAYVMPDQKTAYLSDDGTNVGFYMYIADTAANLSAGTLYAAKWIQTSNEGAGAADLLWIKLGHATDAELETIVTSGIEFADIFNTEDANESNECPTAGFTAVNTSWGLECLQLKSGQEKAAAFLETRRYAAMLGATTEFRKEEGITFSPDLNKLFVAMSEVRKGMEDDSSSDAGGNNDIRLSANACGAVYALDVLGSAETAYDAEKSVINSSYVVKNMYGIVEGAPASYPAGSAYEAYTCSPNGIANPDNITYLAGEDILAIGEDTGSHPNDFIWSYDMKTGSLTRILSTPYGSETTSPFWYKDINGFCYLTAVTQHPFGETGSSDPDYYLVDDAANKESSFGVVGTFDFVEGDGKGSR